MNPDVLVIGAGPAGSVVAREVARRGRRVVLADRANFPRPKVCGCCLNGVAVGTLTRLGLGHVLAGGVPLNAVRIAAGRRAAVLPLPAGVAISREVLDVRLVEAAVSAGVEFRPGVMFSRDAERSAGITVLATGLAGDATPEPGSRLGAGVLVPAELAPASFEPSTIHMATGRGGYVGLVRVEGGRLDVAAAFDAAFVKQSGGLGPAAEAILGEAGWPVPPGLADLPWKGTPALTRRRAKVAGHRLFAVGDAAGYVEPFTGEGMAWAVASAAALAPIAARDWHPGLAQEWEVTHRRVLGRRQFGCRVIAKALRHPRFTRFAVRMLSAFPALARPVVAAINHPCHSPHPATA
jgi:flavin-dependent dehydrogenase